MSVRLLASHAGASGRYLRLVSPVLNWPGVPYQEGGCSVPVGVHSHLDGSKVSSSRVTWLFAVVVHHGIHFSALFGLLNARCKNSAVKKPNLPFHLQVRVINFKLPLQPHEKYYIAQYEEPGVSLLTRMKDYYTTNTQYITLIVKEKKETGTRV